MLDKKVKDIIFDISSTLPSDEDLEKMKYKLKIKTSNNVFYNIFNEEYVKRHIYYSYLTSFHFSKASKIKKFFETNNNDYNLLISSFQKKYLRAEIQRIFNCEEFYNSQNEPNINFNQIKQQLLESFKINDKNKEIFMAKLLEVVAEDYFEKIVLNTINNKSQNLNSNSEVFNQQHYNSLRREIMPKNLVVGRKREDIQELKEENVMYHLTDELWLLKYYFTKATASSMCQEGTLAESFITSNEFYSQIKKYQNQLINYAINSSAFTEEGYALMDRSLPLEQSEIWLKERAINALVNTFKLNLSVVKEEDFDEKIEKFCTGYYNGTLNLKENNKKERSLDQDDFSPVWPN